MALDLADPIAVMLAAAGAFEAAGIEAAAYGGLVVAVYGRARETTDAARMLARSVTGTLRGEAIRIVSPEDYVVLKVLATRERDLEDAASVLEKQRGRLDDALMRAEVELLAAELPDHDVRGRFAAIVHR